MRRIKSIALIIGLVTALSALSGCAAEESAPELVDADQLAGGSFSDISAVLVEGNSSENNSGENASDSAQGGSVQVTVPKSAEYCEAAVKLAPYDEEFVYKVKDIIFGDAEIAPEIDTITLEGDTYPERCDYTFNKDGKYLKIDSSSYTISFHGELSALRHRLFIPPNDNNDGNIGDYSGLSQELDFCSREDAVRQVRELFEKIGVKTNAEADVYALSQSELQKAADKYYESRDDDLKSKFPEKYGDAEPITHHTVDKSEEFYYIVLNADYNNIPIYNYEFNMRSIKELRISNPQIRAIFTVNGPEEFVIDGYRFDVEETKKVSKLLSPENAAKVIFEKYSDVGNVTESHIDTLELMYVYMVDDSQEKLNIHEMKMIPAWVCTLYQDVVEAKRGTEIIKWKKVVLIDAQTGEEII